MDMPLEPNPELRDFEKHLEHVEYRLARNAKGRTDNAAIVHRMLSHLEHIAARFDTYGYGSVGPSMRESLHLLLSRAHRARTAADLRDVVRDARHFVFSLGSLSRTQAMEGRLRELESQVKSAAEVAAEDSLPDDDAVITLDKLKTKKVLFAIMPFAAEFTDVWIGGIKRAATSAGYYPVRIDMITQTSEITDDIVKTIQLAEVVVVDVTRNNANVMFEFGYALALKKPYVVISQSTEFLTFDIKNLRSVIYQSSWQGIETLSSDLQSYVKGSKSAGSKRSRRKKQVKSHSSTKALKPATS
jgi:nucleoside 2-deoxyribosyltransferase